MLPSSAKNFRFLGRYNTEDYLATAGCTRGSVWLVHLMIRMHIILYSWQRPVCLCAVSAAFDYSLQRHILALTVVQTTSTSPVSLALASNSAPASISRRAMPQRSDSVSDWLRQVSCNALRESFHKTQPTTLSSHRPHHHHHRHHTDRATWTITTCLMWITEAERVYGGHTND